MKKIAVIGNACGGKTLLSLSLAKMYQLPLTHVDSIQFMPGMTIRPYRDSIQILAEIQNLEAWIIDGYGPLDILEKRLQLADHVVFIDLPIWRHFWWCTKRQIKNLFSKRVELPEGCSEASYSHTVKLYKTIWGVHQKMRPEMIRILNRENLKSKVRFIQNLEDWNIVFREGI